MALKHFMIILPGILVLEDEVNHSTALTITKLRRSNSYFHPLYKSWNISDDFPDVDKYYSNLFRNNTKIY